MGLICDELQNESKNLKVGTLFIVFLNSKKILNPRSNKARNRCFYSSAPGKSRQPGELPNNVA